jgi:GxxExxY protein
MLVDAPYSTVTHQIIGSAMEVHRNLGPGLLESTYMTCLQYELTKANLRYVVQRTIPIVYKGITLDSVYRSISSWKI